MADDHLVRILGTGGFPVPTQGAGGGEGGLYFGLHFFAAESISTDMRAVAIWTFLRHLALVATAVAGEPTGRF